MPPPRLSILTRMQYMEPERAGDGYGLLGLMSLTGKYLGLLVGQRRARTPDELNRLVGLHLVHDVASPVHPGAWRRYGESYG